MNSIKGIDIKGFTLVELMITVAIAAIVLSAGVPAFQKFIANQQAKVAAQDILITLLYTRSEAVKRNADILLSISRDSSNNLQGWAVTSDTSKSYSDCAINPIPGYCLKIQAAQGNINLSNGATSITYQSSGRISAPLATSFDVCVTRAYKRQVRINSTGLPVIEKTADVCS